MVSLHIWNRNIFYCVAFFWRADEALLTVDSVNSLQTATNTTFRACEAEQPQLPVDLSAFAACFLRSGAIAQGNAPRGVFAVDAGVAWSADPSGHMFRIRIMFPGSEEEIAVNWLPGRIDVQ